MTKKFRTHVGWGRERVFEVINIRNESGEKPNGKKVTERFDRILAVCGYHTVEIREKYYL